MSEQCQALIDISEDLEILDRENEKQKEVLRKRIIENDAKIRDKLAYAARHIQDGNHSFSPLWDFVVVRYGTIGLDYYRTALKEYRALDEKAKERDGELVLLCEKIRSKRQDMFRSTHYIRGEDCVPPYHPREIITIDRLCLGKLSRKLRFSTSEQRLDRRDKIYLFFDANTPAWGFPTKKFVCLDNQDVERIRMGAKKIESRIKIIDGNMLADKNYDLLNGILDIGMDLNLVRGLERAFESDPNLTTSAPRTNKSLPNFDAVGILDVVIGDKEVKEYFEKLNGEAGLKLMEKMAAKLE